MFLLTSYWPHILHSYPLFDSIIYTSKSFYTDGLLPLMESVECTKEFYTQKVSLSISSHYRYYYSSHLAFILEIQYSFHPDLLSALCVYRGKFFFHIYAHGFTLSLYINVMLVIITRRTTSSE